MLLFRLIGCEGDLLSSAMRHPLPHDLTWLPLASVASVVGQVRLRATRKPPPVSSACAERARTHQEPVLEEGTERRGRDLVAHFLAQTTCPVDSHVALL